jgi:hypothetical protein
MFIPEIGSTVGCPGYPEPAIIIAPGIAIAALPAGPIGIGGTNALIAVDRLIGRLFDVAVFRANRTGNAGRQHFLFLVADPQDGHDGAALVGFQDRIDAGIKPRRDERFHVGDGQFLEPGVRQVDDLGDEVVALNLVEVFVGELHRHFHMREVRFRLRLRRIDLQRRIEHQTLAIRNVRELQPVHGALLKIVGRRRDQLVFRIAVGNQPADAHAVRSDEADLRGGQRGRLDRRRRQKRDDAGSGSIDHRTGA